MPEVIPGHRMCAPVPAAVRHWKIPPAVGVFRLLPSLRRSAGGRSLPRSPPKPATAHRQKLQSAVPFKGREQERDHRDEPLTAEPVRGVP